MTPRDAALVEGDFLRFRFSVVFVSVTFLMYFDGGAFSGS